jgi:Asp-tRNA(Asn)/Glu-tRNA(Gln) amidotransferase A subunit family amidase
MGKQLHNLSLIEASQGIKSRLFTSEEYTRALLARIRSLDDEIRAWAWLRPEKAIRAAGLSDGYLLSGGTPRPLEGLPLGVKDIFATAGIPTEMGSPVYAGHIPKKSARVVQLLEAGGAFVMGKTVTTECAFLSPGQTRNPWNPLHTPGGSSSGSAAAVAACFVPAALGTQTNGSVIRPAAYCGVVGFKPTQGLIPIEGALTFSHTLDQAGIFTRRVEDAAMLVASLTGDDRQLSPELLNRSGPPRLAALRTPVWGQAEDYAKRNFIENIEKLRRGNAQIEEVELPEIFGLAHGAIRTIMAVEAAFNLRDLYPAQKLFLSSTLANFLAEGQEIGEVGYARALKVHLNLQEELETFIAKYDAVITPPATGEAPATLEQTGSPGFCSIWSLCGVPAITIPVGFGPRGLPLGLQIAGGRGKDGEVLSAASWCERLFSFPSLKTERS